jgi:hypothetical protein
MRKLIFTYILLALCFSIANKATAQIISYKNNIALSKDSSRFQKLLNMIKGKPNPLIDSTNIAIARYMKSISSFEGKQINTIKIEQRHFGYDVNSPQPVRKGRFSRFANKLHNKTNETTIKKNLFFREGDSLSPLIIAYNEKWLRDLAYIQDARILAYPAKEDSNKVDIFIVTKDILPIGALLNMKTATSFEARLNTENINDGGDAFGIIQNYDQKRELSAGWGFDFTARNILGSFIDLKAGAQTFTNNYANGVSSASDVYIAGNLPLLHPLSRWTIGFDFRQTKNKNAYSNWSDSLFTSSLQYQLKHTDIWAGYQIFTKDQTYHPDNSRYFVQLRYLVNEFAKRPINYLDQIDKNYQNIKAYLASFTVFKQKIIRTQYLYGFGRNEDLPTGNSYIISSGHYVREGQLLPYLGLQYESYKLLKNERFRHININTGTSYGDKQLQDFRFLASLEQISKLYYLESGYRYRHIINLSFAQTLKNKFNEALLINSIYGIPQLNKERIKGGTRIAANWESIWYNSRTFFGFKKAPFVFANLTYIRTMGEPISTGDIYTSIGGGCRVRNENLILGTIELKGYYFPRTNLQLSPWNLSLITNIRFKYNSSIINKPDFVAIN